MLYAKIFTDYESSKSNLVHAPLKKPAGASAQLLTPQSLFCFAAMGMDDTEDLLTRRRRLNAGREFNVDQQRRRKSVDEDHLKQEIELSNQAAVF